MNQPSGVIKKEGLPSVLLNKGQRSILRHVKRESIRIQAVRILRIRGRKSGQTIRLHTRLNATMMGGLIKAVIIRRRIVVVMLRDVPLATMGGHVTFRFHGFGQSIALRRHTGRVERRDGGCVEIARMGWNATGHRSHFAAGWM